MEYIGTIRNDSYLEPYSDIVICGAGTTCERIVELFDNRKEKEKIRFICDKETAKQGKKIQGIEVVSYDVAMRKLKDALYLVANVDVLNCVEMLHSHNIKNIHIVRW